ncbi:MAG: hypothetical protein H7Y18_05405 [Clostridiaceae bacterium]|nr:hypothetical protein [Clostridiaceae bacterium]
MLSSINQDTKGYKVPAMLYLVLSNKLLRPAPFLQYKKESEITNYSKKLSNSLKKDYGFPKKLENTNNISIYGLDVQCVQEGLIAVIKYTTNTEMSNEKEIEKEANGINKEVTNLYLGMKENFKFFMYDAYSEPPIDIKKSYKCYRTIVQQK